MRPRIVVGLPCVYQPRGLHATLRRHAELGHHLGWGAADVLLHVPVERALMQANPQVTVIAPYYPGSGCQSVGWAVGCAVRQGADALAAALEQAVQSLQTNGRLASIFAERRVSWHL